MDSRFLGSTMDLDSLVKAYAAIFSRTQQLAAVPVQSIGNVSFVGRSNMSSQNQQSNIETLQMHNYPSLKRTHEDTRNMQEEEEPECKKQQTQGAFEPVNNLRGPTISMTSMNCNNHHRVMNVCCTDTLSRYTSLIERELIGETIRGTRQALFNAHKLWYSLYQPTIPQASVNPTSTYNTNHSMDTNSSLQQLNALTTQVGQSCFSSIKNLAKQDQCSTEDVTSNTKEEPTFIYSPKGNGMSTYTNSAGASIRKRKCKVTDIMADSPPSKFMASNSNMISNTSIYHGTDFSLNGFATSTLTSAHLRKAKLLFLYARYPSSTNIKEYFPDVRFNKGNTAQLVKWFSNFREYFYIQIEKFARQFASDPSMRLEDITVEKCGELLKILNIHYNRNNRIELPSNFINAVVVALKEFFTVVKTGNDNECSWKKIIYKIITSLDADIPHVMKSADF